MFFEKVSTTEMKLKKTYEESASRREGSKIENYDVKIIYERIN